MEMVMTAFAYLLPPSLSQIVVGDKVVIRPPEHWEVAKGPR